MVIPVHQAFIAEFRAKFPAHAEYFDRLREKAKELERGDGGRVADAKRPAPQLLTPPSNTGVNDFQPAAGVAK